MTGKRDISSNSLSYRAELAAVPTRRWQDLARFAWYPFAAIVFSIVVIALPGFFIIGQDGSIDPRFSASPSLLVTSVLRLTVVVAIVTSLASLLLAVLLFRRRSRDGMALLTSYLLLAYGIIMSGPIEALEPFIPGIATFNTTVLIPLFQPFILLLFTIFPDGRFVPSWTRWGAILLFLITPISLFLLVPLSKSSLDFSQPGIALIFGVNIVVFIAIISMILYAQVYRYRHVSTPTQKQQTKWVLYGIGLWFTIQFLAGIPWIYTYTLPPATPYPPWLAFIAPFWHLSIASIPFTLTIAVMRYRLFEIDILNNRSLLYGSLTLMVVVIYVLVVGLLGTLFQAQGNLLIALLATGIVAVLFQPLRERLQNSVNRLVYGERDDPVTALAQLGRRLETAVAPDRVLPTLVKTIAQTLKLPYVAIILPTDAGERITVSQGNNPSGLIEFPLIYQGTGIGQLAVSLRQPGDAFTEAEMRLLRNIARQAGAAIHAAQLTLDLQRSRQLLVTAREEERLRLRRDLHDGLGPALASVVWQTDSARDMVHTNPDEAVELLVSSIEQAQEALADIRHLVYGLRPPALDELGLVGALEQAATKYQQTAVSIESEILPTLPAAVEVAAYRIVQEAIKNAVTHGEAKHCWVYLIANGQVGLTIDDDGLGLPQMITPGVGLHSMRERAEELGGAFTIQPRQSGGTRVAVSLPLEL